MDPLLPSPRQQLVVPDLGLGDMPLVLSLWLVHRWGWPLVPAAVIAWMGCEQLRGWVLGGFTFAGLGHTQWRWTTLIQCADACGAVGVSGMVMAVAAGVAEAMA